MYARTPADLSRLDAPEPVTAGRVRRPSQPEIPLIPVDSQLPPDYAQLLADLHGRIVQERVRVVVAANSAMVLLYWDIGQVILQRQSEQGWGAKVIDRLAADLQRAFPAMKGLSSRNLKYMRKFAEAWPERPIVQEALAQMPWSQNLALLERIPARDDRLWYASKAISEGWSYAILTHQIERQLHLREGKALSNFNCTLPPPDSDMAAQIFKDPYLFDFLGTIDARRERELEQALVEQVQRFLLELGAGFAFVGRQVHLQVGPDELIVDLLFYHLKLRCFVVVELKAVPFDPAFAGTLNAYLAAADAQLRHPTDNPAIGLLLVRDPAKNRLMVEYALQGLSRPIGVASWTAQLTRMLPEELRASLPTVEELERGLTLADPAASAARPD